MPAAFEIALEAVTFEFNKLALVVSQLRAELAVANAAKHKLLEHLQEEFNLRRKLERRIYELETVAKDDKYRQLKVVLSKKLHPNALIGRAPIEIQIREKMFKEIWPEIEKIDRG